MLQTCSASLAVAGGALLGDANSGRALGLHAAHRTTLATKRASFVAAFGQEDSTCIPCVHGTTHGWTAEALQGCMCLTAGSARCCCSRWRLLCLQVSQGSVNMPTTPNFSERCFNTFVARERTLLLKDQLSALLLSSWSAKTEETAASADCGRTGELEPRESQQHGSNAL